jgi:hypothetical protein
VSKSLNAKFRCRGIWLGAEKIVEGDVVRLLPLNNQGVIDHILIVKEISYVYEHLEVVSPTGNIFLEGRCLTVTPPSPNSEAVVRSNSTYEDLALQGLPKCMRGYTWYDSENPKMNSRFHPDRIVGRCYEREAMELLIYSSNLNIGLHGVQELRRWAMTKQNNNHLGWTWAEHQPGTENHVNLSDLIVGKRRALEHGFARFDTNPIDCFDRSGAKDPSGHDNFSHDGASVVLEKMSTISASVMLDEEEDEADMFVREAFEGSSFANEAEANHVAKKLRV